MKEQTPQQAALMAMIQSAIDSAFMDGLAIDESTPRTFKAAWARIQEAIRQIEAIVCAQPPALVWPEPVAWRVHPHDYGVGTEGVHAITQMQHQRIVWACKDWKPEPLYTHAQIEAMLAKGQA